MDKPLKVQLRELLASLAEGQEFDVLTPPDSKLGDYSTNIGFVLGKKKGVNPADEAKRIKEEILNKKENFKIFLGREPEIAGPGFINFYLDPEYLRSQVSEIIEQGDNYGSFDLGQGQMINVEFVSANPTGPLMAHNFRGGPFGDTLGNILKKVGYKVIKEYYINDTGVQVMTMGESVAKHVQKIWGLNPEYGDDLYKGEYIHEWAEEINELKLVDPSMKFSELVNICRDYALEKTVAGIQQSLKNLGIEYNVWFNESALHDEGKVKKTLEILKEKGFTAEKEGATWLKVDSNDSEKDAVLVKSNGATTYLMNDIAYTKDKYDRGAEKAINIWGADHHGDVARLSAGVAALGFDQEKLKIMLHQLITIKKGGEKQRMSKRAGKFVSLDELLEQAGKDAIRFFFLMKDLNTHMEFDIDLATEQSKRNPVFYFQYALARLNSIFEKIPNNKFQITNLESLKSDEELKLMRDFVKFPDLIWDVSQNYQIHHLAQYALNVATDFHKFYENCRVIDEGKLNTSRLTLARATDAILKNCANLMEITATKKM